MVYGLHANRYAWFLHILQAGYTFARSLTSSQPQIEIARYMSMRGCSKMKPPTSPHLDDFYPTTETIVIHWAVSKGGYRTKVFLVCAPFECNIAFW